MALSTASITDLREKSNKAVTLAEADLNTALSLREKGLSVGPLPEEHARSFDQKVEAAQKKQAISLEHQKEIEEAASASSQRVTYGLERWNSQFVRLERVVSPPHCALSDEQLRDRLWSMVRPGIFKRFQEIFSDPHNYIVPKFTVSNTGMISFVGKPDTSRLSVAACLVSPDRIQDELAESLGLLTFTRNESRNPTARFLHKARDESAIQKLKLIFDSSRTLGDSDFRVLLIQRPGPDVLGRYPELKGHFPAGLHGSILYSREDFSDRIQSEKPAFGPARTIPKIVAYFSGLPPAERKTLHARQGYDIEQDVLESLSISLDKAARKLGEWRKNSSDDEKSEIKREVTGILSESEKTLDKAVNAKKTEARDLLGRVRDIKDSLKRPNPLITAQATRESIGKLQNRVKETHDKGSFNERDRMLLRTTCEAQSGILLRFEKKLSSAAALLDEGTVVAAGPLHDDRKPSIENEARVRKIMNDIVPDEGQLKRVNARPFSTYANLLRLNCAELREALLSGNTEGARVAIIKMGVVGKMFSVSNIIDSAKEDFITSRRMNISDLAVDLVKIENALKSQHVDIDAPSENKELRGYLDRLKVLQVAALDVKRKLEEQAGNKNGAIKRRAQYSQIKTLLGNLQPEALAWELVPLDKKKDNAVTIQ